MRRRAKPARAKVEAKLPVARKPPENEGSRVRDLEQRLAEALKREKATQEILQEKDRGLTEALDQQTATSAILRVISGSPTDVQPVLDAVAENAARLCESSDAEIFRRDGDRLRLVAHYGPIPVGGPIGEFTQPLVRGTINGRSVLSGRTVHVADLQNEADEFPQGSKFARQQDSRAHLSIPLMREAVAIGTISLRRTEAGLFTERQVALLQTFADQAVIAIENVRLFKELEARNRALTTALEQQTATSEILRVISGSPTDVQPVFETIATNAVRLCGATNGAVFRFDGELIHLAAQHNVGGDELDAVRSVFPIPPERGSVTARAILTRSIVHVEDLTQDPEHAHTALVQAGFRTILSVPMLREGLPIGTINVTRMEVKPFSPDQITLLQTFADQAVIAIENVRLFTELQASNRDLTETLEQQTATAEILRVISRSPTDLQPIFDTIVRSASQLCAGQQVVLISVRGNVLDFLAGHHDRPEGQAAIRAALPAAVTRATTAGRAVLERRVIQIPDIVEDGEYGLKQVGQVVNYRATIGVPLMRDDDPIGVLVVGREPVGYFSERQVDLLKTFADQAVIAIENVRLFTELQEKNRALTQAHAQMTEALEQQTATAEILGVISSSPTDVQPVFDTIAEHAMRLCHGHQGFVYTFDGEFVHLGGVANVNVVEGDVLRSAFPIRPSRGVTFGRAILTQEVTHIPDVRTDPEYSLAALAQAIGVRGAVAVPMFRDGRVNGAIGVARPEPGPFSERQIALLQTFADQAVIAIENVRLFTELQEKNRALTQAHAQVTEALEQQTATSEILRVISSSPTDAQPVFDTIARSAMRLCDAAFGLVTRYDGEVLRLVAHTHVTAEGGEALRKMFPMGPGRSGMNARVILEGGVVHLADAQADQEYSQSLSEALRLRSALAVPMLRDGQVGGTVAVGRLEVRPFTDNEIALLQTFADQAVIAVENVRLFTELQASNRDLTTALDTQTATSDILRVISRSQTDVQPVFDAIAGNARRLLEGHTVSVARLVGDELRLMAFNTTDAAADAILQAFFPIRPASIALVERVMHERTPVIVTDMETDSAIPESLRELSRARGWRSVIWMPMVREDTAIGMIAVSRRAPRGFADGELALLKTFADQAVIAIENVRLFTELQERNEAVTQAHAQVTESLEQQTATSDILRVIARSPTSAQPVFEAIAESAARLTHAALGGTFLVADGMLHLAAVHLPGGERPDDFARAYPIPLDERTLATRVARARSVVTIVDTDPSLPEPQRQRLGMLGIRSLLMVPMLRDDQAIGMIGAARREPIVFADNHVALLRAFADQAVIAIENVRLFTELQTSNRDLTTALDTQTATSDILRVISRSQTDVQPVFDAILSSAVRLLGAYSGGLTRITGDQIELAALTSTDDAGDSAVRATFPRSLQSEAPLAQIIRDGAPLNVTDAHTDPRLAETQHAAARARGYRSVVIVPMLRHEEAIGAISVTRRDPGGFTDDEIALLKTFADQAVIAIENARLLTELQARTQELSRSVGELQALGEVGQAISSTLDLRTVLSTIVARATQLSGTDAGVIYEYDAERELFEPRATERLEEDIVQMLEATPIRKGQGATGRLAESPEPMQVADLRDVATQIPARDALVHGGYRAVLAVPLVREGHLIGGLTVFRKTPGEFALGTVDLLRTFATQSALAIQNARLFREIEEKSHQLEVASQHKSEFLANMSHELRTPLNAIIGFSEVLTDRMFGELNEKQDEYLKDIYASGTHLLSLINDILDLSKIEAGRMELELTDFHLPTALDNALTLVRERAGRRSITLQMSVDERLGEIRADERKIRQVVLNLLSNAIKFTPEGGRIEVRAVPVDGSVEVSVSDTGIGIAPEDQEAVFEEFRQVGTAAKKVEGTGLGLALSRKFVELHGGRIWVKSQLGAGSTFTFTLPVLRGE